jgi:superfamily II DNA or RNA helicase
MATEVNMKNRVIPGLVLRQSDNPLFLEVKDAHLHADQLRTLLTATNTSVSYQIFKSNKRLTFWRKSLDYSNAQGDLERASVCDAKIKQLLSNIEDLIPKKQETFYVELDGKFLIPAGFWWMAVRIEGDVHRNTTIIPECLEGLRDYQAEALTELLQYNRGTLSMGTGLGKSLVAANIAVNAAKAGLRTLVVVPTEYLVGQMVADIKKHHESVTGNSSKRRPKLGSDVMVSTVQSAKGLVNQFNVLVFDESHHMAARTWMELLMAAERATHVYNLTATPFRTDGMDLAIFAFGGPVVYERTVRWGIDSGWLAKPKIYSVEITPHRSDGLPIVVSKDAMDTTAYKRLVSSTSVFKYLKRQLNSAITQNKKCIILFKTIQSALRFKKYCKMNPIIEVAHAKNKGPLYRFCQNESNLLVGTDKLISEGINIPNADVLFTLLQNSSNITTFQALGRALRKTETKTEAIIIDIGVNGFGQFESAREKRKKIYQELVDEIKVIK